MSNSLSVSLCHFHSSSLIITPSLSCRLILSPPVSYSLSPLSPVVFYSLYLSHLFLCLCLSHTNGPFLSCTHPLTQYFFSGSMNFFMSSFHLAKAHLKTEQMIVYLKILAFETSSRYLWFFSFSLYIVEFMRLANWGQILINVYTEQVSNISIVINTYTWPS